MIQDELPLPDAPSTTVLVCDHCLRAWLRPRLGAADTAWELRHRAVSLGWECDLGSDTCPLCVRKRDRLKAKETDRA